MAEGGPGRAADPSSTESYGCCGLARLGRTSPTDTPRSRPAIGAFSTGFAQA
jgi:hypothetical protein